MFYVYEFNQAVEDFEAVGAFSVRAEAEAYIATNPRSPDRFQLCVVERTWKEFTDCVAKARLGDLATALAKATSDTVAALERVYERLSPEPATFEQRVVIEHKQLGERLHKLRDFLDSKKFNELSDAERARLNRQVTVMSEYFEVLTDRLDFSFQ